MAQTGQPEGWRVAFNFGHPEDIAGYDNVFPANFTRPGPVYNPPHYEESRLQPLRIHKGRERSVAR